MLRYSSPSPSPISTKKTKEKSVNSLLNRTAATENKHMSTTSWLLLGATRYVLLSCFPQFPSCHMVLIQDAGSSYAFVSYS
jgi:hypothetical protein